VKGSATMPMPGSPMFGSIDVKRTAVAGRYTADAKFDMAGTWRTSLQWTGSSTPGSVTFSGNVQ
jgi:YtkA-like